MNQRQLIELGEDQANLGINLSAVVVDFVVRLLHQLLELVMVL